MPPLAGCTSIVLQCPEPACRPLDFQACMVLTLCRMLFAVGLNDWFGESNLFVVSMSLEFFASTELALFETFQPCHSLISISEYFHRVIGSCVALNQSLPHPCHTVIQISIH